MAHAVRRSAEPRRSDARAVPEAHEAKVFKALGDPTRYQIVRTLLAEGEVACSRLVEMFSLSAPALSHHFRVLEECGLLEVRKEGIYHFFRINAERLEQAVGSLGVLRGTRRR